MSDFDFQKKIEDAKNALRQWTPPTVADSLRSAVSECRNEINGMRARGAGWKEVAEVFQKMGFRRANHENIARYMSAVRSSNVGAKTKKRKAARDEVAAKFQQNTISTQARNSSSHLDLLISSVESDATQGQPVVADPTALT